MAAAPTRAEKIRRCAPGEYVVVPMCAQPPALTVAGVPFPRLSEVVMRSFIAACGAVSLLAFSAAAQAVPTENVQAHHRVSPCRAPASAPWAITSCNPLGRSRGPGAGAGKL
jgi:hypothetical protein